MPQIAPALDRCNAKIIILMILIIIIKLTEALLFACHQRGCCWEQSASSLATVSCVLSALGSLFKTPLLVSIMPTSFNTATLQFLKGAAHFAKFTYSTIIMCISPASELPGKRKLHPLLVLVAPLFGNCELKLAVL